MSRLKIWNSNLKWEESEAKWDAGAEESSRLKSIKRLTVLPDMPGITPETAKHLKWKSLKWMIAKDDNWRVFRAFMRHPITYSWRYLRSVLRGKPYKRDGDFFLYGIKDVDQFEALLKRDDTLLVVGFSYCHKPFECPSGRFTDQCVADPENPVCRQCFIGKAVNALPEKNCIPLFIPTIHYVAEKILGFIDQYPHKQIIFLITACEMTLEMFGDWGNMAGIRGIGVRLDGRICNTMKAFELSETGIKPGLTVVLEETKGRFLDLIRQRRDS